MVGEFGQRIRRLREGARLTQEQLGERLGVTATAVSHWERGRSQPPAVDVPRIPLALGVTICELYGIEEGHTRPQRPGRRWAQRLADQVATMSPADQEFVRELAEVLQSYRERLRTEEGLEEPARLTD